MLCVDVSDKTLGRPLAVDTIDRSHGLAAAGGGGGGLDSSLLLNFSLQSHGEAPVPAGGSADDTLAAANHLSTNDDQQQNEAKAAAAAKARPICMICNKSFHTRYKLNEHHAVVHLDKKLFSCNVCQKKFGRADHLIRHVKNRVCIPRELADSLSWPSTNPPSRISLLLNSCSHVRSTDAWKQETDKGSTMIRMGVSG